MPIGPRHPLQMRPSLPVGMPPSSGPPRPHMGPQTAITSAAGGTQTATSTGPHAGGHGGETRSNVEDHLDDLLGKQT